MGKFRDSLKEELKEELKDVVYEKAKTELKEKVKARYDSKLGSVLRFFGFNRTRRRDVESAAQTIKEKDELYMSESMIGILELFTINMTRSALDLTTIMVSENQSKVRAEDIIKDAILDEKKEVEKESQDDRDLNKLTSDDNI